MRMTSVAKFSAIPLACCLIVYYVTNLRNLTYFEKAEGKLSSPRVKNVPRLGSRVPPSTNIVNQSDPPVSGPEERNSCVFPNYTSWDVTAMKFYDDLPPHDCGVYPALSRMEGRTLVEHTRAFTNNTRLSKPCQYQAIRLVAFNYVTLSQPFWFRDRTEIPPDIDYIRVTCEVKVESRLPKTSQPSQRPYQNFHHVMQEKPQLEKELQRRMNRRQSRSLSQKKGSTTPDAVSVLMFGMDSVSWLNHIRHMPRTRHFLLNELDSIEFSNYNKVSDNTLPNMFTLFAGRSVKEGKYRRQRKFDEQGLRLLWTDFAEEGYRTLLTESYMPVDTGFFHVEFSRPPTHYYGVPLEMAKHNHSSLFNKQRTCFAGTANEELLLGYTLDFHRLFRDKPTFSFTWAVPSTHNRLNGAGQVDGYYEKFLRSVKTEGLLNNTLLVFLSDHGLRAGTPEFIYSHVGKFEEMRPFLYLVFPRWFANTYPSLLGSVKANAARLSTPRDLRKTLLDVLYLNTEDPLTRVRPEEKYGVSFFGHIPANRNCMEAGIEHQFCVCHQARPLSTKSPLAAEAGRHLVHHLNAALTQGNHTDDCHLFTLSLVTYLARWEGHGSYHSNLCKVNTTATLLHVKVRVEPSDWMFEGVVLKCDPSGPVSVLGEVNRVYSEGDAVASRCLKDTQLEGICACKKPDRQPYAKKKGQ